MLKLLLSNKGLNQYNIIADGNENENENKKEEKIEYLNEIPLISNEKCLIFYQYKYKNNLNNNFWETMPYLWSKKIDEFYQKYNKKKMQIKKEKKASLKYSKLIDYGIISFKLSQNSKSEKYYYDLKNGINRYMNKDKFRIGCNVYFRLFLNYNKKKNITYFENIKNLDFIAFDVHYNENEIIIDNNNNNKKIKKIKNSLLTKDPIISEEFNNEIFEGILITKIFENNTGFLISNPNKNNNEYETLIFHKRYFKNSEYFNINFNELEIYTKLEFNIGINPINFGYGIYPYVAYNIIISNNNIFNNLYLPIPIKFCFIFFVMLFIFIMKLFIINLFFFL